MEIGSRVKCIAKSSWEIKEPEMGVKCPIVNKIYTVRGFYKGMTGISIYLEEIRNSELPLFHVEPSFEKKIFVELLPDEELELVEELEEELV
jgi:hypothetical protein